jgi:hypothetical protein
MLRRQQALRNLASRFEQEGINVFNPEILADRRAGFLGEIDGSGVARVDLHLFLRPYLFGLGHGRDSLESRGQPAPPLEMSRLREIDLAGAFKKSADSC